MNRTAFYESVPLVVFVNETARSPEAMALAEIRAKLQKSRSGEARLSESLRRLAEAAIEAQEPDWNGYGAQPVDHLAVTRARAFLGALPVDVPLPEISIDPDGEVAIEWTGGRGLRYSISIGATGRITYAGIFGGASVRGEEDANEGIAGAVLGNLRRLRMALPSSIAGWTSSGR